MQNVRCEVSGAAAHLRLGANRAGMNVPHAFAVCSFMDEMANAAGKDTANYLFTYLAGPRKLDLKAINVDYPNYGAPLDDYPVDVARLQNVLQFAMDRSGWGGPLLPRQGRGIAIHRSYVSYAAAVVVVTVASDGQITIARVDIAIDCGQIVNPDRMRALMEDSVMFGIGLTLYSNLTVKSGAVEQANFDGYKVARADMLPEIHVHVVPSTQPPSGAGDPGVPVIAPAICNAIFAATGKRIRALPVDTSLLRDDAPTVAAKPAAAPVGPAGLPLTPTGPIPK
jgi:isoquinoline 1-oxidoreductase beta subunit